MLFIQTITSRAMNGELDFTASLRARVALLRGAPADIFERLKGIITITPGALELCRALKQLGYKLAVLSGGFTPLAQWLAEQLGLEYAYANDVSILKLKPGLADTLLVPLCMSVNAPWRFSYSTVNIWNCTELIYQQ